LSTPGCSAIGLRTADLLAVVPPAFAPPSKAATAAWIREDQEKLEMSMRRYNEWVRMKRMGRYK
jgi:hypothetical protein